MIYIGQNFTKQDFTVVSQRVLMLHNSERNSYKNQLHDSFLPKSVEIFKHMRPVIEASNFTIINGFNAVEGLEDILIEDSELVTKKSADG